MKLLSFLLALAASSAFAIDQGPRVSRGGLLKDNAYRTNGALTFFVDAASGNDANGCVATGAGACLTIKGALSKAPKQLRNLVTINLAAGNYAGAVASDFSIDPSVVASVGLLIDGALANSTGLTTGTATGTATSGSAGTLSTVTFGTLVDSGQTWTVNNLRGKFITILTGTGSGQTRVIASNTSTTITIAGNWTAPAAASTYAVQDSSVFITSPCPSVLNLAGGIVISGGAFVVLSSSGNPIPITIRNVSVPIGIPFQTGGSYLALIQVQTAGNSSVAVSSPGGGSRILIQDSSIQQTVPVQVGVGGQLIVLRSLLWAQSSTVNAAVFTSVPGNVSLQSVQTFNLGAVSATGYAIANMLGVRCDCGGGGGTICVKAGSSAFITTGGMNPPGSVNITQLDVANCDIGLSSNGSGSSITSAAGSTAVFSGVANTYGIVANYGGSVSIPTTGAPGLTAGTAEVALDNGAQTSTFAAITPAPNCLISLNTDSKVCRL